jgi:hypothetical protein
MVNQHTSIPERLQASAIASIAGDDCKHRGRIASIAGEMKASRAK